MHQQGGPLGRQGPLGESKTWRKGAGHAEARRKWNIWCGFKV